MNRELFSNPINLVPVIFLLVQLNMFGQSRLLDAMESTSDWNIFKSENVEIKISNVPGIKGKAIRLDYNFVSGSGYGGMQKAIPISFPDNYEFSYKIKASSPKNNFEFKLIDESKENVWWQNQRGYNFPEDWKAARVKKKNISFAWGPTANQKLTKTAYLQFTVASNIGGKGYVIIDELQFTEKPPPASGALDPTLISDGDVNNSINLLKLIDGDLNTIWFSKSNDIQTLYIDFPVVREIGMMKLVWDTKNYASVFSLYGSTDSVSWEEIYKASGLKGNASYIRLEEAEWQFMRIVMENSSSEQFGIAEIKFYPPEAASDINSFYSTIAKDYPEGYFPRYFSAKASYWTVLGVDMDREESMINTDGMIESKKNNFSIEPFLYQGEVLYTYKNSNSSVNLEEGYLPIPSVTRENETTRLKITAFAHGSAGTTSSLNAAYMVKNLSKNKISGKLILAIRPFMVNPPYQFLNNPGGATNVFKIKLADKEVLINKNQKLTISARYSSGGVSSLMKGDIISYIRNGTAPKEQEGEGEYMSAALIFNYSLEADADTTIMLNYPYYHSTGTTASGDVYKSNKAATENFWVDILNHFSINGSQKANNIFNVIRSNIAYILINKDSTGIQPGSRSYERSWIRDGALTSSALLRVGLKDEVKEFIRWYAQFIFPSGKVPCVVDSRGGDPVPENDSNGEFIFLVTEYYKFSKDKEFLLEMYPFVQSAVTYIKVLTDQRSTNIYTYGDSAAFFGLVPESISHEGYSAKPMHSYWDNFFTYKGLVDAVFLAAQLGKNEDANTYNSQLEAFKGNLINSISLTTAKHGISYIPGCVELGDFDATSTTIAMYPTGIGSSLNQEELYNTFEKYYNYFTMRRTHLTESINYTPYEVRIIGAMTLLGQTERANELLDFFLNDQRPREWNHWAEVVWQDKDIPNFIGDMPHTWVGSDFINSIRLMMVYEKDSDSSLVLFAGINSDWLNDKTGLEIKNINTYYGNMHIRIGGGTNNHGIVFETQFALPAGGALIHLQFLPSSMTEVKINGRYYKIDSNRTVHISGNL